MLNLERLRTLDALARHGSVGGAADGLHVTTSAVSQQMAKLEREVGQPLLAKNGRGVRLTDAGRLLAEHAARIISQVELAQADVEAARGCAVGELRIAAFPTAMRGLLPQALAELRADHPELRPRVREQEPGESMAAVVRGDLDMALAIDWHNKRMPVPAELTRAHLLDDSLDIAVPAAHPLARRSEISLAEFGGDDWISWTEGQFCHEWLVSTLRGTGIEPRITHIAEEHHTQLAFVEAGLGVCVAPRLGRGPVPPGVRLLPVCDSVRRHVYVVWRADADRRPSIRAAVEALRRAASAAAGEAAAAGRAAAVGEAVGGGVVAEPFQGA